MSVKRCQGFSNLIGNENRDVAVVGEVSTEGVRGWRIVFACSHNVFIWRNTKFARRRAPVRHGHTKTLFPLTVSINKRQKLQSEIFSLIKYAAWLQPRKMSPALVEPRGALRNQETPTPVFSPESCVPT